MCSPVRVVVWLQVTADKQRAMRSCPAEGLVQVCRDWCKSGRSGQPWTAVLWLQVTADKQRAMRYCPAEGLVQVCRDWCKSGRSGQPWQQYLREEAFEFVATLVKYVLWYLCTFCYCCVCCNKLFNLEDGFLLDFYMVHACKGSNPEDSLHW